MYTIEGLLNGIENKKKNVAVLKTAIEKEQSDIAQYRIMISQIQEAAKQKQVALDGVHLEIVRDGSH